MAVSFLKKGASAHKSLQQAEAATEAKKEMAGVRRFWMPKDAETQITFLDGALTDEGLLDTVAWWEHNVKMNGSWMNWFPCVAVDGHENCPICEGGESPAWVAAFTVIDHTEWTDKNGQKHANERRLYVCKRETFKRLQKYATKHGGLAGCKFDVARIGEKAASVGTDFDFIDKTDLAVLAKKYKDNGVPYEYEKVIKSYTAQELRELGFGSLVPAVGSKDVQAQMGDIEEPDYDTDL